MNVANRQIRERNVLLLCTSGTRTQIMCLLLSPLSRLGVSDVLTHKAKHTQSEMQNATPLVLSLFPYSLCVCSCSHCFHSKSNANWTLSPSFAFASSFSWSDRVAIIAFIQPTITATNTISKETTFHVRPPFRIELALHRLCLSLPLPLSLYPRISICLSFSLGIQLSRTSPRSTTI